MQNKLTQGIPFQMPFFYGWIIVAIAALTFFFSGPGQTFFVSVFINYYIEHFGWSRSLVSSYYSFATLVSGLILIYIGRSIDRIGHRKVTLVVSLLLGLTCFGMSLVNLHWMLLIGFFLLRLLGQGSMSLLSSTLVPQWFFQRRGLAMSLMSLGVVLSSALVPPLNHWLTLKLGVAATWQFWGLLLIFVMAPLGWLLIRNRPEDMGLQQDGLRTDVKEDQQTDQCSGLELSWTLREAMRTRAFWLILYCVGVPAMINTGLIFHIVSIIETKGLSAGFATSILSIMALTQFPVTFLAGHLVDRYKVHRVMAFNFGLFLVTMLLIIFGQSSLLIIVYGVLFGIFGAFNGIIAGVIWPNYFGRQNLGSIQGVAMATMVLGSALGPLPFGVAYDWFGGYREILLLMMLFPALAAAAALISPPPKKE